MIASGRLPLSKSDLLILGTVLLVAVVLSFMFSEGVGRIVSAWEMEEYSHGYLIPFIFLYLVWQKRKMLSVEPTGGSWAGVAIMVFGLFLLPLGELSTLYVLLQYGLVISFTGFVYAAIGWRVFRHIWVAFLLLFFMVPLPDFLYKSLSSELQLISSEIGVWVVRLFGISVYLEGNVIDLGTMKLQVVEACSGLRYLFPLSTLAFIVAVFFRGAWWKKAIIFVSSLPITVLMNSFRIGVIGVLVEYWGQSMAEGFLHDFEGWLVFMAAFAVVLAEVWLFAFFARPRVTVNQILDFDDAQPISGQRQSVSTDSWKLAYVAISLLSAAAILSLYLPNRSVVTPDREVFSNFPVTFSEWQGTRETMEPVYLNVLQLDDYLLTNYTRHGSVPVNLYVAYYASQTKDVASHSPRACLPGDGWQIESFDQRELKQQYINGVPLRYNRVLMSKGEERRLVYYWFQQRGRLITNEYLVKWYLFLDALRLNRTDGSLVRLTVPVTSSSGVAKADEVLEEFIESVTPELSKYIPM